MFARRLLVRSGRDQGNTYLTPVPVGPFDKQPAGKEGQKDDVDRASNVSNQLVAASVVVRQLCRFCWTSYGCDVQAEGSKKRLRVSLPTGYCRQWIAAVRSTARPDTPARDDGV